MNYILNVTQAISPSTTSKKMATRCRELTTTGCRFNTELTTRCLCWHTIFWTRLYHHCASASTASEITYIVLGGALNSTHSLASTAASTHGHYARRLRHCSSAIRSHRLRETFFSMRRTICLELTSSVSRWKWHWSKSNSCGVKTNECIRPQHICHEYAQYF